MIVLGNVIAASASALFIGPHKLIMGGITGVGFFFKELLKNESAVSAIVFIANAILYVIGIFFLGKKFAFSTLLGTFLYPAFMGFWEWIFEVVFHGVPLTYDLLLSSVLGGLFMGVGVGLVVREGSSTGGTDIPALIGQKYFGIPVEICMWAIDFAVLFIQMFVLPLENILYGIITIIINTIAVGFVVPIGLKKMQVKIVSEKYKEIREMILNELVLGCTVLYGQTGLLQEKCHMLLTVVSNRNLARLKNAVQKIDPNAFLMISVVSEVRGRGFTTDRVFVPHEAIPEDLKEVRFGEDSPEDHSEE